MFDNIKRAIRNYLFSFSYREILITLLLITVIGGIVSATTAIVFRNEIFYAYRYGELTSYSDEINVVLADENIQEIEIQSEVTSLNINRQMQNQHLGGKVGFRYSEYEDNVYRLSIGFDTEGSTLRIYVKQPNRSPGYQDKEQSSQFVNFYIPASYDHKVTVKTQDANIQVDGHFHHVATQNKAGATFLYGRFDTVEASSEAGDIYLSGHAVRTALTTEAGILSYDIRSTAKGNAVLEAEAGSIHIYVPNQDAASFAFENEVGDVLVFGKPIARSVGREFIAGNRDAGLAVRAITEVGDIRVELGYESSPADQYFDLNLQNNETYQYEDIESTSVIYSEDKEH